MSGYKLHIIMGFVFTIITGISLWFLQKYFELKIFEIDWKLFLISLPFILIFSILPDYDIKTSKIYLWITFTLLILLTLSIVLCYYFRSLVIIGILIFSLFFRHRGVMHSVLAGLLLSLLVITYNPIIAIICFISYCSHLFVDMVGST